MEIRDPVVLNWVAELSEEHELLFSRLILVSGMVAFISRLLLPQRKYQRVAFLNQNNPSGASSLTVAVGKVDAPGYDGGSALYFQIRWCGT